jgi:hypothetical protein
MMGASSSPSLSLFCFLLFVAAGVQAVDRYYYMSAYALLWDYCPDQYNSVYDRYYSFFTQSDIEAL